MIVCNHDLRPFQIRQHIVRHQLAFLIVTIRIVRLQNTQTVLDRDPWRNDQKSAREPIAARMPNRVHRLPRDQHRHHRRLARTRRHLQRPTHQLRIRITTRILQIIQSIAPRVTQPRRNLRQPNHRFRRLYLTEKGTIRAEFMTPPMLQQPLRLRRHAPIRWIRQLAPSIHQPPNLVHISRNVVLLTL